MRSRISPGSSGVTATLPAHRRRWRNPGTAHRTSRVWTCSTAHTARTGKNGIGELRLGAGDMSDCLGLWRSGHSKKELLDEAARGDLREQVSAEAVGLRDVPPPAELLLATGAPHRLKCRSWRVRRNSIMLLPISSHYAGWRVGSMTIATCQRMRSMRRRCVRGMRGRRDLAAGHCTFAVIRRSRDTSCGSIIEKAQYCKCFDILWPYFI